MIINIIITQTAGMSKHFESGATLDNVAGLVLDSALPMATNGLASMALRAMCASQVLAEHFAMTGFCQKLVDRVGAVRDEKLLVGLLELVRAMAATPVLRCELLACKVLEKLVLREVQLSILPAERTGVQQLIQKTLAECYAILSVRPGTYEMAHTLQIVKQRASKSPLFVDGKPLGVARRTWISACPRASKNRNNAQKQPQQQPQPPQGKQQRQEPAEAAAAATPEVPPPAAKEPTSAAETPAKPAAPPAAAAASGGEGEGASSGGCGGGEEEKKHKKRDPDQVEPRDKRDSMANEVVLSEKRYVASLRMCITGYLNPLLASPIVDAAQVNLLFSNIQEIYVQSRRFQRLLQERIHQWETCPCFGDIFFSFSGGYIKEAYSHYTNNFDSALELYYQLVKDNPAFNQFVLDTKQRIGLDLSSYLVMPVQRMPRYLLLLSNLVAATPEDHPDYAPLQQAVAIIRQLTDEINDNKRKSEERIKWHEVKRQFEVLPEPIRDPPKHLRLIKMGVLRDLTSSRSAHAVTMFLLDGFVLVATEVRKKGYKAQKLHVLGDVAVEKSTDSNAGLAFVLRFQDHATTYVANTEEERDDWLESFQYARTLTESASTPSSAGVTPATSPAAASVSPAPAAAAAAPAAPCAAATTAPACAAATAAPSACAAPACANTTASPPSQ